MGDSLCKYKNMLGIPNQGFHASRFFGFALNDILGTIGIGIMLAYFTKIDYIKSIFFVFMAGTFLHYIFCVDTAFMKLFK